MKSMGLILLRVITVVFALAVLGTIFFYGGHGSVEYKTTDWPFDGITGTVDKAAAKRGYQVYSEVCSTCHGLRLVAYRNLEEIGFSEDEIKAIAAEQTVRDGPDDEGEMFDRDAKPFDKFVPPYPNENASRAMNNGSFPPDLSLIIKARHDGANYLYSLMQGYEDEVPEGFEVADGMNYNKYFKTKQIAMGAPLYEDAVEYEDGTTASLEQLSRDLTIFLQWAAEPEMELRKQIGRYVLIYLFIFTILFYLAKKRIWARVKDK